jgi:hypothetical protein
MQPHRIKVGAGVILVSVDGLAVDWGVPEKGIVSLLATFAIPIITLPGGDKRYVSLYSLESALFEAGLPTAFRDDQVLVRCHQELAGVLYGTLSKEVIRERCKSLAASLRRSTAATVKYPGKKRIKTSRSRRD